MQPRMGGKEQLQVFIKGNRDLEDSLLAADEGLAALVREKYHGAFRIETVHEPCAPSGLLLQQLEGVAPPEELSEQRLGRDGFVTAQFESRLFEQPADVVVLSLEPEVRHAPWRHRQQGYLFCPPPGWEEQWSPGQREWLQERFTRQGLIPVSQFRENFVRLIRAVKQRLKAHVVVYNCSTVDPQDQTHSYRGVGQTLALRVHEFNRALMEVSVLEGISIVDVDRLVAELGANRHLTEALSYSAEAHRTFCREFLRVLEEIGFFEKRPLVMQVGHKDARCS